MCSRFFVSIGLVIASLVLGCATEDNASREVSKQTSETKEVTPTPATTPAESEVAIDQIVIELVLVDLSEYEGREPRGSEQIYLAPEPAMRTNASYLNAAYRLPDLEYTKKNLEKVLTPSQIENAREAETAIQTRIKSQDGYKPFVPRDPRIKIYVPPATKPTDPFEISEGPFPVRVAPPGYSRDGRYAVVYVWLPWGAHGEDVTYVLERDDSGTWKIIHRQFFYFA